MECRRCGKCCSRTIIALHNIPISNDKQELEKWLNYHGIETVKIFNGKEDVLAIKFNQLCQYAEEKNGIFTCKIYKDRPQICKDYYCSEYNLEIRMNQFAKQMLGKI